MTVYITGLLLFIMQLMIPCQVLLKMNGGQKKRVGGQRQEDTRVRKRDREKGDIRNRHGQKCWYIYALIILSCIVHRQLETLQMQKSC